VDGQSKDSKGQKMSYLKKCMLPSHAASEKAKSEASDLGIPVQQHLEIILEQIRLDQVLNLDFLL
jgi:hypothetical protein